MSYPTNNATRIFVTIGLVATTSAALLLAGCRSCMTQCCSPGKTSGPGGSSKLDQSSDAGTAWEFKPEGGEWSPILVPAGGWRAQGYHCDAGTYRTWIAIPKNVDGRRVRLSFEAINFGAEIFAGQDAARLVAVAQHVDGWLPVTADLTPWAAPGGRILVQVEVAGRKKFMVKGKYTVPEGATWYPGLEEGIIRGVHLELLPTVRVEDVFVRTRIAPDTLEAAVTIVNDSDETAAVTLVSKINSASRAKFNYPAIPEAAVTLPAHSRQTVELGEIPWNLGEKSYWWPNLPYRAGYRAQLHKLDLAVTVGGKPIQRFSQRFGFRQFQVVSNYYELNGVRCNLRGDNQQEADFGTDAYGTKKGFGPPTAGNPGWPQAVDNLQRLNFNVLRIHQIPATPYMLEVCDEMGLMLVEESPLRGSEGGEDYADGKTNMLNMDRELVLRERNHPAVVIWSAANEWKDPVRDASAVIRSVDPTRIIIADGVDEMGPDVINMEHYVSGISQLPVKGGARRTDRPYGETEAVWANDNTLQGFAWMATSVRTRPLLGDADLRNYVLNNAWPNYVPGESDRTEILEKQVKHWGGGSYTMLPAIAAPWHDPHIQLMQQCYHPLAACDVDFDRLNASSNAKGEWPVIKPKLPPSAVVTRHLAVFNDELVGFEITLRWELRRGDPRGKILRQDAVKLQIPPGEFRVTDIQWSTPVNGDLALVLKVWKDGLTAYRMNGPLSHGLPNGNLKNLDFARWYATKWTHRVVDAIDQFSPDFIYFDGGGSYPFCGHGTGKGLRADATPRVIAHLYNTSMRKHGGKLEAMAFTKGNEDARAVAVNVESRVPKEIKRDQPWQTENGLGEWFYKKGTFYDSGMVIHEMLEAVSKDGNYAVNIPLSPAGELDPGGVQTLEDMGDWMAVNSEGIYDSSAWDVWGEGSVLMAAGNLGPEQAKTPYTAKDIRFTTKNGAVYAYLMAWPTDRKVIIHSLGTASGLISDVTLFGMKGKPFWEQTADGLEIALPSAPPGKFAFTFKVTGQNLKASKATPTGK